MKLTEKGTIWIISSMAFAFGNISAQEIRVDLNQKGHDVAPSMYGVFFEEINHSGDGGIYAELVRNRNFEEHVLPSGMTYVDGFAVAPHSLNYEHGGYRDWKVKWDLDSLKTDGWKIKGDAAWDIRNERSLDPATPNYMVNSKDEPYDATLLIAASKVYPQGTVVTLSNSDKKAENSMDNPERIVPQTKVFKKFGKKFRYKFEPNSFTILRVKSEK